jgi:inhibitor of KinA
MTQIEHKIVNLSESAVVVEFGRTIDFELNDKALDLASSLATDPFPGFIEAVPAYASTTVFYDPVVARLNSTVLAELLAEHISNGRSLHSRGETSSPIEIPVDFSDRSAPDLADISARLKLKPSHVIDRFLARTYRVFMIGFLPGFAYMGEVDEAIAVPRKEVPRTAVPKGSVGLAGKQTGIYPLESPGGWQIIGRTSVEMFTPDAKAPSFLKAGDEVRFVNAL